MRNFYEVLGVQSTATLDEIKRAYRALAKTLHPDTPTGDTEKFAELSQAYSVLSDPGQRSDYDLGKWEDKTSKNSTLSPVECEMINNIRDKFIKSLKSSRFNIMDALKSIKIQVSRELQEMTDNKEKTETGIENLNKSLNDIKDRGKENLWRITEMGINVLKSDMEATLKSLDERIGILSGIKEMIEEGKIPEEIESERDRAMYSFFKMGPTWNGL
jgi:curved DNA-binding protein CbpA